MDIEVLTARYPRLYHMAEPGSWPSIRERGLLSTSAVLDRWKISGPSREQYESHHRPEKVTLRSEALGAVVLRDQKPMPESRLRRCLRDDLTPQDWYQLLNAKTFFWVSEERLTTLLNARAYRNEEHDVLVLRTEPLVRDYCDQISLCHMNSGNTFPAFVMRGLETFTRIGDYPVNRNGVPRKPVVELVVDYAVENVRDYVIEVRRMRQGTVLDILENAG